MLQTKHSLSSREKTQGCRAEITDFIMVRDPIDRTITQLTQEAPTYEGLCELHDNLRTLSPTSPEENVERYALIKYVSDIVAYLDFVEEELEKSIGYPRREECQRIVDHLEYPDDLGPIARIDDLITQWLAMQKYSRNDVRVGDEPRS